MSDDTRSTSAPETTSDDVKAALHAAIEAGDVAAVRELLPRCAMGLRRFAVQKVDEGPVELIRAFAPFLSQEARSWRLGAAARDGDLERMAVYADAGGHLGRMTDPEPEFRYPLHSAAQKAQADAVRWLLERGAWVDAPDGDGWTALHLAVDRGWIEVVEVLMAAGADPTRRAEDRSTPNTLARTGSKEMRSALRKRKKAPPSPEALHLAASAGRRQEVERLVKAGAGLEGRDAAGCTALMVAAAAGKKAVVGELVRLGAEVDATSPEGDTALLLACRSARDRRVTSWSFAGSADIVVRDGVLLKDGEPVRRGSARALARKHFCVAHVAFLDTVAAVESLVQADASPLLADAAGVTPLQLAEDLGVENLLRMMRARIEPAEPEAPARPDPWRTGSVDEILAWLEEGATLAHWPRSRSSRDGHTRAIALIGDRGVALFFDDAGGVAPDLLEVGDRAWLRERLGSGVVRVELLPEGDVLAKARAALADAFTRIDEAVAACGPGQGLRTRDGRVMVPGEPWHVLAEERQQLAKAYPLAAGKALAALVGVVVQDHLVGPEAVDPALLARLAEAAATAARLRSGDADAIVTFSTAPQRTAWGVLGGEGVSVTLKGDRVVRVDRAYHGADRAVDEVYGAVSTGRAPTLPLAGQLAVAERLRPLVRDPVAALALVGEGAARATVDGQLLSGVAGRFAHGDTEVDAARAADLLAGWTRVELHEPLTDLDATSAVGSTPLHAAVNARQLGLVGLLLAAGASTEVRDSRKRTPLIRAAKAGATAVVARLLEGESDPTPVDKAGMGAIHWAVLAPVGAEPTVAALLDGGVSVDQPGGTGRSALVAACMEGAPDRDGIVRFLLERGADPDACGPDGVTPLYAAVFKGKPRTVEALLAGGATADKDRGGWTPLMHRHPPDGGGSGQGPRARSHGRSHRDGRAGLIGESLTTVSSRARTPPPPRASLGARSGGDDVVVVDR